MIKNILAALALLLSLVAPSNGATLDWIMKSNPKTTKAEASRVLSAVYSSAFIEGVDPSLVFKVIKKESSFHKSVVSSAGAIGYMQIVPKWHKDKLKGKSLYDTEDNIAVGVKILKILLVKYKGNVDRALRAYNGSHGTDRYSKSVLSVKLPEGVEDGRKQKRGSYAVGCSACDYSCGVVCGVQHRGHQQAEDDTKPSSGFGQQLPDRVWSSRLSFELVQDDLSWQLEVQT